MTLIAQVQSRWSALHRYLRWAILVGLALGFTGSVFLYGYGAGAHQLFPGAQVQKVERKVFGRFGNPDRAPVESQTYATTLLTLRSDVGIVPTGLSGSGGVRLYEKGGGLTSFGEDVLLLPYTGEIFAASSGSDIRKTGVRAPENGRDAYLAAARSNDGSMAFHEGYLRYNDLQHVELPDGQALIAAYTEFHAEETCYTNTLARLDLPADASSIDGIDAGPNDWEIIHRTSPCLPFKGKHLAMEGQMAGGRLAFQAPATLLMTSGDFHFDGMRADGPAVAQDPDGDYGKLIAIDLQTGIASHVSMGHRNMQGLVARADGSIWLAEHGPRGGDELNRITPGANYGWPRVSLGTTYAATPLPNAGPLGRHDGYAEPVMAWVPSIAVSGLADIQGFHTAWDGDLLAASLADRALHRIRLEGDRALYNERIPLDIRVREVHQHSDGRLVIWTDQQELIFFTAEDLGSAADQLPDFIANLDVPDRVKTGMESAMGRCVECHSLIEGDHRSAPSLARIFGDPLAATSYAGYSDALSARGGRWTREALIAFLQDPAGFAPGTSMPDSGIEDPRVAEAIAGYLQQLDETF